MIVVFFQGIPGKNAQPQYSQLFSQICGPYETIVCSNLLLISVNDNSLCNMRPVDSGTGFDINRSFQLIKADNLHGLFTIFI